MNSTNSQPQGVPNDCFMVDTGIVVPTSYVSWQAHAYSVATDDFTNTYKKHVHINSSISIATVHSAASSYYWPHPIPPVGSQQGLPRPAGPVLLWPCPICLPHWRVPERGGADGTEVAALFLPTAQHHQEKVAQWDHHTEDRGKTYLFRTYISLPQKPQLSGLKFLLGHAFHLYITYSTLSRDAFVWAQILPNTSLLSVL